MLSTLRWRFSFCRSVLLNRLWVFWSRQLLLMIAYTTMACAAVLDLTIYFCRPNVCRPNDRTPCGEVNVVVEARRADLQDVLVAAQIRRNGNCQNMNVVARSLGVTISKPSCNVGAWQPNDETLCSVPAQSSSVWAGFICRRFAATQWLIRTDWGEAVEAITLTMNVELGIVSVCMKIHMMLAWCIASARSAV